MGKNEVLTSFHWRWIRCTMSRSSTRSTRVAMRVSSLGPVIPQRKHLRRPGPRLRRRIARSGASSNKISPRSVPWNSFTRLRRLAVWPQPRRMLPVKTGPSISACWSWRLPMRGPRMRIVGDKQAGALAEYEFSWRGRVRE